jgi:hypothetical protein
MGRGGARRARLAAMGLLFTAGSLLTACAGQQTSVSAATVAAASTPAPTATQQETPQFPVADPGGTVDAASQQKADGWLAGAALPPGAVKSSTEPAGVADGAGTGMWCAPMADAIGYWTLPNMSADDAMAWLEANASQSMVIASASGNPRTGDETNVGGFVVDEPTHMSLEAMIFTVTPIGAGSGIRADAFAKAASSVCATPPPGTMLGIGG